MSGEPRETRYRLVFAGEVLDGFDTFAVRRRFREQFKLTDDQLDAMFFGRRTTLKRALLHEDALRAARKLKTLGASVSVEVDEKRRLKLVSPAPPEASIEPAFEPSAAANDTLAKMAQQLPASADAQWSERLETARMRGGVPHTSMVRARVLTSRPVFQGRMARAPYAVASGLLWIAINLLLLWVVWRPTGLAFVAFGLGLVGLSVLLVRATTLRLHDMDTTGRWAWFGLAPIIGPIGAMVLMFIPGTNGDNRYGRLPREGHRWTPAAMALTLCVVVLAIWALELRLLQSTWVAAPPKDLPAAPQSAPP